MYCRSKKLKGSDYMNVTIDNQKNTDFVKGFVPAFGEFVERLNKGTLDELPKVSDGLKKWKKWADEIETEN